MSKSYTRSIACNTEVSVSKDSGNDFSEVYLFFTCDNPKFDNTGLDLSKGMMLLLCYLLVSVMKNKGTGQLFLAYSNKTATFCVHTQHFRKDQNGLQR